MKLVIICLVIDQLNIYYNSFFMMFLICLKRGVFPAVGHLPADIILICNYVSRSYTTFLFSYICYVHI